MVAGVEFNPGREAADGIKPGMQRSEVGALLGNVEFEREGAQA
jgi:hypothetical protein